MEFTKMQGAGNDYLYINCLYNTPAFEPSKLAKRLSNRHFGIGSDGLILIYPSKRADVRMEVYNADGSHAQMCGNGLCCLAKYVYERGLLVQNQLRVETLAGIRRVWLNIADGKVVSVRIDMGPPELRPDKIPILTQEKDFIRRPLVVGDKIVSATVVSMGNPHCVVFCDKLSRISFDTLGSSIERHRLFPERTNVEFAQVLADGRIRARVWERGNGETMACGTGATAILVAGVLEDRCKKSATIIQKGGDLFVEWAGENENVYLTGKADFVFDGVIQEQLHT